MEFHQETSPPVDPDLETLGWTRIMRRSAGAEASVAVTRLWRRFYLKVQ
jgi:hypothetical protein